MKFIISFSLYLFVGITFGYTQNSDLKVSIDERGRKVAVGLLNEQYLLNDSSYTWFKKGMEAYMPDNDAVAYLQRENKAFSIIVYGGTWCSDTQDLLPKFFRVVHDADIDSSAIKIYGLDADKLGIDKVKPQNEIEFVPTFIIMKDGKELGRIVETARRSIEKDMMYILKQEGTR